MSNHQTITTVQRGTGPPLLQWDGLPGRPRNPVSWFFYHGGSTPADWGLGYGTWATVTAVFPKPCHWHEPERFARDGEAAFFALAGCKDRHPRELCLFPETLRSELHGVRSVLEAHSKRGKPADAELGTANGIAFQKGHPTPLTLRVTAADGTRTYNLDRWD